MCKSRWKKKIAKYVKNKILLSRKKKKKKLKSPNISPKERKYSQPASYVVESMPKSHAFQ